MSLSIHADVPPLRESEDGVVRIADTRIPLERVIESFLAGLTPEQIAQNFDALKIEDIYAVINYYLHHRDEVEKYISAMEADAATLREQIEKRFEPIGIRDLLLARRRPTST
jgi:uncharacterized protein (DUF433 family)